MGLFQVDKICFVGDPSTAGHYLALRVRLCPASPNWRRDDWSHWQWINTSDSLTAKHLNSNFNSSGSFPIQFSLNYVAHKTCQSWLGTCYQNVTLKSLVSVQDFFSKLSEGLTRDLTWLDSGLECKDLGLTCDLSCMTWCSLLKRSETWLIIINESYSQTNDVIANLFNVVLNKKNKTTDNGGKSRGE